MVDEVKAFPWKVLEEVEGEFLQRVFLFYGQSGAGKTTLAAQFGKELTGGDVLFLACDPGDLGGALSALKWGPKHLKIESYSQLINLIPILKENAGKEFSVLVVDSVSYMQRIFMAHILQTVGRELPRFEEWNLSTERMRTVIKALSEVKCHVIFTATESTNKDEITGQIFGGPNLPGKLAQELPQACDIVAHLSATSGYDGKMKRCVTYKMVTVPDGAWFARDRTSLLPTECIVGTNPDTGIKVVDIFKPLFRGKGGE